MEKVFSFFLYGDEENIYSYGYVIHELEGTDEDKKEYLLKNMERDKDIAIQSKIEPPIKRELWRASERTGTHHHIFEEVFNKERASQTPLFLITQVLNNKIAIDHMTDHKPFSHAEVHAPAQYYPLSAGYI